MTGPFTSGRAQRCGCVLQEDGSRCIYVSRKAHQDLWSKESTLPLSILVMDPAGKFALLRFANFEACLLRSAQNTVEQCPPDSPRIG